MPLLNPRLGHRRKRLRSNTNVGSAFSPSLNLPLTADTISIFPGYTLWDNPNNILTEDDTSAIAILGLSTFSTSWIVGYGFFVNNPIPLDATITSIDVRFRVNTNGAYGGGGGFYFTLFDEFTEEGTVQFYGPNDLSTFQEIQINYTPAQLETPLEPSQLNEATFGVGLYGSSGEADAGILQQMAWIKLRANIA